MKLISVLKGCSLKTLKAYQLQVTLLIRHFEDVDIDYFSTSTLFPQS
jgi:hypothetical protein